MRTNRSILLLLAKRCLWIGLVLVAPLCSSNAAASQETLWTPEDAQALTAAQSALQAGNAKSALATLDGLLQRYPGSVDAHRLRGHALVALGRDAEARAALAKALSRGAFSSDVLSALLQIDYAANHIPAVLSTSRLMLLLEPENPEWSFMHADLLLQNGQSSAAEVVYAALLDRGSVSPDLFERLARTAYADGRGDEAASLFETAYYMGSEDASVPDTLARLWLELGDSERSQAWSLRAVDQAPLEDGLRAALRTWSHGDHEGALVKAADVEANGSIEERAEAAALMGRIERRRGDGAASLAHFRRAVDQGLEDPDILALLGSDAYNAGRLPEAVTLLSRAWDAGRRDASILPFLVQGAVDSGQPELADRILIDYLERNGLDDTARRLIARRADVHTSQ